MTAVRFAWMALGLAAVSSVALAGSTPDSVAGTQYADQANDPMQVELLFKEGTAIIDILKGLKSKGFAIDFKEKQIPPSMTLLSLPKSTRIDEVLREILAPWNLSLYHNPYGRWVVRPETGKRTAPPSSIAENSPSSEGSEKGTGEPTKK